MARTRRRSGSPRPRIVLVVGTRPEAIKMAPVVLALKSLEDRFETILCSTGQHRELLTQALEPFGLAADLDLALMRPNQSLADLTGRAVPALDAVFRKLKPDLVVVQGDTTSAFVGALAAFYRRTPIAHLEAGLRTGDMYSPFPEEVNRRLISTLASLHFAPTSWAANRLSREGFRSRDVLITGNTVIDALLYIHRQGQLVASHSAPGTRARTILITMHRRESYGAPFERICSAIQIVADRHPELRFRFPMHPAPSVRRPARRFLESHPNVELHEPLRYPDFVAALSECHFVLTDSGGIQEEAPALAKPVLVLRKRTERPEAIRAGTARLVGTSTEAIVDAAEELLSDPAAYDRMAQAANPFGDGRASSRVAAALSYRFGFIDSPPLEFFESVRTAREFATAS